MAPRDLESGMWAEAIHVLDRADRLQRHFFRPGSARHPQWQPPVDVFETNDALWVFFALPGVAEENLGIEVDGDVLIVRGERRLPTAARNSVLHRLEIPHGRFERRLRLPLSRLRVARHELRDGCLYLQLRKTRASL